MSSQEGGRYMVLCDCLSSHQIPTQTRWVEARWEWSMFCDALPSHRHPVQFPKQVCPFACWNHWLKLPLITTRSLLPKTQRKRIELNFSGSPVLHTTMIHSIFQTIYDPTNYIRHGDWAKCSTVIYLLPVRNEKKGNKD